MHSLPIPPIKVIPVGVMLELCRGIDENNFVLYDYTCMSALPAYRRTVVIGRPLDAPPEIEFVIALDVSEC